MLLMMLVEAEDREAFYAHVAAFSLRFSPL